VKNKCRDSPCHSPEELRTRLIEETLTLDEILKIIISRIKKDK